jgi:hypothetical protein
MQSIEGQRSGSYSLANSQNWSRIEKDTWQDVDLEASVLVPALQSTMLGVASGAVLGCTAAVLGGSFRVCIASFGVGFAVGFAVSAFESIRWSRTALRSAERYIREEQSHAQTSSQTVRLEVKNGKSEFWQDLPITSDALEIWAQSVTSGGSLSISRWTGNKSEFTRPQYEALLDYMHGAGIVRWVNPEAQNQGRELSPAGKNTLLAWLNACARAHAGTGRAAHALNDGGVGHEVEVIE